MLGSVNIEAISTLRYPHPRLAHHRTMQITALASFVWHHPLNRQARMAALLRVARWQFGARLLQGPIALPYVDDTHLFVKRGMMGATGNWYCGLHEVDDMAFVLHMLRPGDVFLDVGANVGSYTVLAAGGAGARTISVEPIPTTFKSLRQNVLLNGLDDRVELHCAGLSSADGTLRFSADLDTMNHILAEGEDRPAVEVPVFRMDDLLRGRVPAVIKIDVEGHEKAVLEGGAKTLSDPALAAVVMEVNGSGARYGIADDELLGLMRSHGFEPVHYDGIQRRVSDWSPTGANAVFVRDRDAVQRRVATAPRHRLVNGTI